MGVNRLYEQFFSYGCLNPYYVKLMTCAKRNFSLQDYTIVSTNHVNKSENLRFAQKHVLPNLANGLHL